MGNDVPPDYLAELGTLALASRLRRLLGILARDGAAVYAGLGVEFEIRWFPVLHLLDRHAPLSITQIAEALGLTHPAVVQVAGVLTRRRLVRARRSDGDRRRRELALTAEGARLVAQMAPAWRAFEEAGREVATEADNDLLAALAKTERALARRSLFDRIAGRLADQESGAPRRSRSPAGARPDRSS